MAKVFANKCHYCGRRVTPRSEGPHPIFTATEDHYRPKSLLRRGDPIETVTACTECNSTKGATPPEVYIAFLKEFGPGRRRLYREYCYDLMLAGLPKTSIIEKLRDRHGIPKERRRA